MKLFENGVGRPSNEIKKKRKIFVVVIACIVLIALVLGTYSLQKVNLSNLEGATTSDKKSINTQRKAILAVAEAYDAQGSHLQYDSYRKNLNCTPEDSTSKHTCYTVCSGLVYMTYKQALGMELPIKVKDLLDKTKANLNGSEITPKVIFYSQDRENGKTYTHIKAKNETIKNRAKTKTDYNAVSEFKNFLNNDSLVSLVRAGDILVWDGHAMLVKEYDKAKNLIKVIHATGVPEDSGEEIEDGDFGRYNTQTQEEYIEKNAVREKNITVNNIKKNAKRIAILRYINKKNPITLEAVARLKMPKIEISKIILRVDDQSFATPNEELTYRVKITNNSDDEYKDIIVKEYVDTNAVLVDTDVDFGSSSSYVLSNTKKTITLKIPTLLKNQSVELDYKVRIKKKDTVGKIIKSKGSVGAKGSKGKIATSYIETRVGKKLTSGEITKLKNCFNDYSNCFREYKEKKHIDKIELVSGSRFVNTLYKASLGIDLGLSEKTYTVKDLFIFEGNKLMTSNLNNEYLYDNYFYNNYYGLRIADFPAGKRYDQVYYLERDNAAWEEKPKKSEMDDRRARTVDSSKLIDGDVVIAFEKLECDKCINEEERCNKCTNEDMADRKAKFYIYLDKKLRRYIKNNETGAFSFEEIENKNNDEKLDTFLRNLVGDYYIILRPHK